MQTVCLFLSIQTLLAIQNKPLQSDSTLSSRISQVDFPELDKDDLVREHQKTSQHHGQRCVIVIEDIRVRLAYYTSYMRST